MKINQIDTQGKADIYTIDNFLSDSECDHLIKAIDERAVRSSVAGGDGSIVSDVRTSFTAAIQDYDDKVKEIDSRIHDLLEIPLERGEPIQGQRYDIGQEFKHHTDYFDVNSDTYHVHTRDWGQRTLTFMLYLNDVEEGGETEFPELDLTFKPKKGQAVVWDNLDRNDIENPNTLHSGLPVIKGKKYIITKWFRKGVTTVPDTSHQGNLTLVMNNNNIQQEGSNNQKVKFSTAADLPFVSELGFKVIDVPQDRWNILNEIYQLLKGTETDENMSEEFIKSEFGNASTMLNMDHLPHIRNTLHESFRELHEQWCGNELELATFYGIRSYQNGATLVNHTDRLEELHISSIIIVDEDSDEPWPLTFQTHDGRWHEIYAKPGQMILYESAKCMHGRTVPFKGRYFRNAYMHFKFKNYEFSPQ